MIDHQKLRDLFERALDLDPAERIAFAERACADDASLRERLIRLLGHESQAAGFLSGAPDAAGPAADAAMAWVGRTVDGFAIRGLLARGGMGVVFEAQQASPNRRVALKTLQGAGDSTDLARRMRVEAEVLGLLNHPGIAQVYGAGTLGAGPGALPYIAMEFVEDARSVRRFAEERGLSQRARIELFLQACAAVEYGHRKGIVHRDLKPGNLLVDPEGRVKVIDFGLARISAAGQLDISLVETVHGGLLGTLEYMSPEHVSGRTFDVDVQSDVYSLGCVLLELLSGRPPRDFEGLSIPAAVQRLQASDPELPAELPRELRWILIRALERRPEQRYPSVREFADDLERHLAGESVHAVQPTAIYQLAKFGRRHRALLLATAAVIVALGIGIAQARAEARRARDAQAEAETQRGVAERQLAVSFGVANFLRSTFLAGGAYREGADTPIKVLVLDAAEHLEWIEDPLERATLASVVAEGLVGLEEFERARQLLEPQLAVLDAELGLDAAERVHAWIVWVDCLERLGEYEASLDGSLELMQLPEAVLPRAGLDYGYLEQNLIALYNRLGRYGESEQLLREALARLLAEDEPDTFAQTIVLHRLGDALQAQGRAAEALQPLGEALEFAEANAPPGHPFPNVIRMSLGMAEWAMADLAAAERSLESALAGFDAGQAPIQNRVAVRLNRIGLAVERFAAEGREPELPRLEQLLAEAEAEIATMDGEPGRMTVGALAAAAMLARIGGEPERALETAQRGIDLALETFGPESDDLARLQNEVAQALRALGRSGEALEWLERIPATADPQQLARQTSVRALARVRAQALAEAGRAAEARGVLERALAATPAGAADRAATESALAELED